MGAFAVGCVGAVEKMVAVKDTMDADKEKLVSKTVKIPPRPRQLYSGY